MAKTAAANLKTRLAWVVFFLLFLWPTMILARLCWLQVYKHADYVNRAYRQQQRLIEQPAMRGVIYDRNGSALAMTVEADTVFAYTREIKDVDTAANLLAPILGVPVSDVADKLRSGRNFVYLARKIDAERAQRIKELPLQGIYLQTEPQRVYPKGDLAAQVIGYVGMDDNGLSGVERSFDSSLSGMPGSLLVLQDAFGKQMSHFEKPPEPGAGVVLTIDEKIQYIVEKELERAMKETGAVSGTVVVENPHTGEILALANRPTFNPNRPREITNAALKNHAVSDVFEPGSMFKVCTLSGAIEERVTTPEEVVNTSPGAITVGRQTIHDHGSLGAITVAQVLAKSSNVGAVKIGLRLGPERFFKYIQGYGFGKQTGVELPGETRGLVKPPAKWSGVSNASMSIGQEIGVTPLQIISMISTIANDGVYTPPHIVQGLTPASGFKSPGYKPSGQRRVVSPETAMKMKLMMEQVILNGTARRGALDGYTAGGKTGTAQKVDPKTHKYSKWAYIGSFAGFAPLRNPVVSVLVTLDSAHGEHQGGQVSAPVFARITQQILAYLNVPHDTETHGDPNRLLNSTPSDDEGDEDRLGDAFEPGENNDSGAISDASAKSYDPGLTTANRQPRPTVGDAPQFQPEDAERSSAPPPAFPSGQVQQPGGVELPSCVGQTLRQCLMMAQQRGFVLQVEGHGVVRKQYPEAGSHLAAGSRVMLRLGR